MLSPKNLWTRARLVSRRGLSRLDGGAWFVDTGRPPLRISQLDPSSWVVRRPRGGRRLAVDRLDDRTWVLRGPGSREVVTIGGPRLRADLVVDWRSVRERMPTYQRKLSHHLAEEHVAWMLRELEVNCVLDVGANRGQYGRRLRRAGYTGRIVSFEPLAEVADVLERRAARDPEWHVVRSALGDEDTKAEMMVAGGQARMSSLRSSSEFGRAWSSKLVTDEREAVVVHRLDGIYDELTAGIDDPRVYLKLDTQGYDLQAFAGAAGCIDGIVGMQSEVSAVPIYDGAPRFTEQIEVYEAAGFEISGMFPVTFDKDTMRVIEFDVLMLRTGALSRRSPSARRGRA